MSVPNGFLALLTLGPAYGSQLQFEFGMRATHRKSINAGQVYATLERLIGQGFVRSAGVTDDGLPLYRLTPAGSTKSQAWLTSGPAGDALDRDEMLDQILIGASLPESPESGPVDVLSVIAGYRTALLDIAGDEQSRDAPWSNDSVLRGEARRSITGDVPREPSPATVFALRARELAATASLAWLDDAEAAIRLNPQLFALDRNASRPRRGRPRATTAGTSPSGLQ